jgi:hypothetical protein
MAGQYSWSPINPGYGGDYYGATDIGNMFGIKDGSNIWGMVYYNDYPEQQEVSAPSQYSYQVQVPYEYYQDVDVTTSYPGVVIAQTFIAPRAGWLTELGLFYTKIAADGDVQVLVCRTVNGKPDMSRVMTRTTLARADMKKYSTETPQETKFPVPPVMLKSGERYAIVEITLGAHYAAMAEAGYTEGTFFTGTDGEFFQGDIYKDRKFKVYMARFLSPRTEVNLQTVSLAGGINNLSIQTEQPQLDGASLHYEIQIGGVWQPLKGNNLGALSTVPDLIPLRAVFTGTADIQVGMQLGANRVIASRPTVSSTVVSKAITTPAKRYFQVDIVVPRWDETKNTITCQMLSGVGFATVTASSTATVLDEAASGPGWKRLRFTFDIGSNITTYKVKSVITRTTDGKSVRRMERTSVATG